MLISETPPDAAQTQRSEGASGAGKALGARLGERSHLIAILALALIWVFYVVTIRPGHPWGDDFAMYVMEARNIAHGVPYDQTGYIYNPSYPALGPQSYPPVYPAIMAPAYALFGFNLFVLKAVTLSFFFFSVYVLYRIGRPQLPLFALILLIALVGLNPYFWDFKDELLSDLPFMFFVYLALYCALRLPTAEPARQKWIYLSILGVATALAIGTRVVGLILVPVFLALPLLYGRRPTPKRLAVIAIIGVAALAGGLWLLTHQLSTYLDSLNVGSEFFVRNLQLYAVGLATPFSNGHERPFQAALALAWLALAGLGFVLRLRRERPAVIELFAVGYPLSLLPLATQSERYLIPLVPLVFYYAMYALRLGGRRGTAALCVLAVVTFASYAARYSTLDRGPLDSGIETATSGGLFRYVRESTSPSDVFIFRRPRALVLMTDRRASVYHRFLTNDIEQWVYVHNIGARYIIASSLFEEDRSVLKPFLSRLSTELRLVFDNGDFQIYEVSCRITACSDGRGTGFPGEP